MRLPAVEPVDDEICAAVRAAIEAKGVLPVTAAARRILAAHPEENLSEAQLTTELAANVALAAPVPVEVGSGGQEFESLRARQQCQRLTLISGRHRAG